MMTLEEILAAGQDIWAGHRADLPEISVCIGVIAGDIAREARAWQEGRTPDLEAVAQELGNLATSAPRWAVYLGLSPQECVRTALEAQRRYREAM